MSLDLIDGFANAAPSVRLRELIRDLGAPADRRRPFALGALPDRRGPAAV